jgi:acetyl-CoA carboxylase biotin carboxyl carrier protein
MIDLEFIEKLVRLVDETGIDHIEVERGGTRMRVSKTPVPIVAGGSPAASPGAAAPSAVASSAPAGGSPPAGVSMGSTPAVGSSGKALLEITSPMVGTFYRAPSPDVPSFVDVGTRIAKGDPLCIIEAMKLMNELEADVEGTIAEICVTNGEPVEYGQLLFRVDPG